MTALFDRYTFTRLPFRSLDGVCAKTGKLILLVAVACFFLLNNGIPQEKTNFECPTWTALLQLFKEPNKDASGETPQPPVTGLAKVDLPDREVEVSNQLIRYPSIDLIAFKTHKSDNKSQAPPR